MFRHLLKPLWKRKSRNLLLSLEICLAFIVVFAIAAGAARYYQLYQLPTGFAYADVWSVQLQLPDDGGIKNDAVLYDKFKRALQALPEVEQVAFAAYAPYEHATWTSEFYVPESAVGSVSNIMQVSDDFFATVSMSLLEGRWFSSADEGAAEKPVVVNRRFAEAMFPGESALGKIIYYGKAGNKDRTSFKVTGVFDYFRNQGEFMAPTPFVLTRFSPISDDAGLRTVLLKVKAGTSRAFESTLSTQLKRVRNDWSYRISPLSDRRAAMWRDSMAPLIVVSVVAAFLLLMVAFGLFGVLWQNTTQRIPEIGIRRAAGATRVDIYGQIIIEQVLLTSMAMLVGLILLVQLPITGVFGEHLSWPLFLIAAVGSMTIMAMVSVLCALYPAWRASRLSPTEALHYE